MHQVIGSDGSGHDNGHERTLSTIIGVRATTKWSEPEVVRGLSGVRWMDRKAPEESNTVVVFGTTVTQRGAI
jgi:hypothetical protein